MLTQEQAEQIAFALTKKDSPEAAFLADGSVLYFSRGPQAVISLIQAIYDHKPDDARRILRTRIFSTKSPTLACHGMIKVAAKRMTAPIEPQDHGMRLPLEFHEVKPRDPPPLLRLEDLSTQARALFSEGRVMEAAFHLAEEIPRKDQRYESDRKVAAILVKEDGSFIAASRNANAKNRTRHAEVNLVQGFLREFRQKLPLGARLYVTLKCCKMCAAMIWCEAENIASMQIIYGEDDPGPNGRNTVFSRLKIESQHKT